MASIQQPGDSWFAQVRIKIGGIIVLSESKSFTTQAMAQSLSKRLKDTVRTKGIPATADLRFHDLRHTVVIRLFWTGLKIEEVAQISGHTNWSQLRRYTHIRPEDVHRRWGQLKN